MVVTTGSTATFVRNSMLSVPHRAVGVCGGTIVRAGNPELLQLPVAIPLIACGRSRAPWNTRRTSTDEPFTLYTTRYGGTTISRTSRRMRCSTCVLNEETTRDDRWRQEYVAPGRRQSVLNPAARNRGSPAVSWRPLEPKKARTNLVRSPARAELLLDRLPGDSLPFIQLANASPHTLYLFLRERRLSNVVLDPQQQFSRVAFGQAVHVFPERFFRRHAKHCTPDRNPRPERRMPPNRRFTTIWTTRRLNTR